MNSILTFISANLFFIPLLNLILLNSIPSGNLFLFRTLSFLALSLLNGFLIYKLKFSFKKPNLLQGILFLLFLVGLSYLYKRFQFQYYGASWDIYGMWNVKSRDYMETFLRGNEFKIIHWDWVQPGYPVFIPLFFSFFQILFGEWKYEFFLIYHYGVFAFNFLLIYSILENQKVSIFKYYLLANLFLLIPIVLTASNQLIDFSVAVFGCLGFYYLHRLDQSLDLRKQWVNYLLLGLSFGLILHTKEEGLMFFIVLSGYTILFSNLRRERFTYFVFLPTAIFFFVLMVLYKKSSPVALQFSLIPEMLKIYLTDPKRYERVVSLFVSSYQFPIHFADLGAYLGCLLLFNEGRKYLLIPLGVSISFVLILLITTYNHPWHIILAQSRLQTDVLQVLFFIGLSLKNPEELT
ncbi:MAG: hypothetical protein H7A24_12525 [Leptospiraceae bacterium]|nr:hypothetical protein [Leptospiraceae bacterium]MCP5512701.1 hypothetical protein [Leptospiraceae bacterium]